MTDSIFTDTYPDDDSTAASPRPMLASQEGAGSEMVDELDQTPPPAAANLTTTKRKPGRPPKARDGMEGRRMYRFMLLTTFLTATPVKEKAATISYTIIMYSYREMKKPKSKRNEESAILKLGSDEPFDTFKGQLLATINETLKPKWIRFEDYKITFTVPRHQTSPLSLKKDSEYAHLVECACKTKSPVVKIFIEGVKEPMAPNVCVPSYVYASITDFMN